LLETEDSPKNQARNQLGTPGGAEFSERDPNFLNYRIYSSITRKILYGILIKN